ncbi:MAG: alpha/beta fold hydrolase [Cyanobacteria bacterium P01_D01_bin.50]
MSTNTHIKIFQYKILTREATKMIFNSSEDSFDAGNSIDSIFNTNPFLQNASDFSTTLNINNYFQGSNLFPVIEDAIINTEPQNDRINAPFTFGFYTVGDTGKVNFDYLLNGGAYQGELGIFSLTGLGKYEIGSDDFVQEAARLALSNSTSGYVVISEQTEGARYKTEDADSGGEYKGIKTFEMNVGDQFGIILAPDGTLEEVFDNPRIGGSKQPIFSLASMNPQKAFHIGHVKDVTGGGSIWAMEDLNGDRNSDRDFNDFVFYLEGAVGNAHSFDTLVNPVDDWRGEDVGRDLLEDESGGKLSIPQPDSNPTTIISVEEIINPDNDRTSRIFVKGENIRILGNSNTQDLEFYIGETKVDSTVIYQEQGNFEANLNIPDGIDLGEYEVKIVAQDRESKDFETQPYLIEVINGGDNYLSVTHEGDSFNVGLHTVDNQDFTATDKDIWIIVHGWNNNSSNWLDFAETLDGYSDDDLVLLLDWGEGAQTGAGNLLVDALNQARGRIDITATGIAKIIEDKLGVSSRSRINLIGHSLGAYVSGEIAQRMGEIDKLILLDPANQSSSEYIDDVNFSEVSNFSRAFYSSALGDYAIDADESYLIIQDDFIDDSINYAQDLLFGLPNTIEG